VLLFSQTNFTRGFFFLSTLNFYISQVLPFFQGKMSSTNARGQNIEDVLPILKLEI